MSISIEQKNFLSENKGKLFEYYLMVSKPKFDNRILGNIQIWVYGHDRDKYTPHCHIMLADRSIEFEVDIFTWDIFNVKAPLDVEPNWSNFSKFRKPFFKWLETTNILGVKNKIQLYFSWDSANPDNTLSQFIKRQNIEIKDEELIQYIDKMDKSEEENNKQE